MRSQPGVSNRQQTPVHGGSLTDLPDWARSDANSGTAERRRSRSRQAIAESHKGQALRQRRPLVDVDDPESRQQDVPETGLFYHKQGQSLVESNVAHDLTGYSKMSTTIGRHPFTFTVVEYGHPGVAWWTLPCVAMSKCALLKNQVDWYRLYSIICTRRRSALQTDPNRIKNAFELNRIIEQSQSWAPNLLYYDTAPGYISLELSRRNVWLCRSTLFKKFRRHTPKFFTNMRLIFVDPFRNLQKRCRFEKAILIWWKRLICFVILKPIFPWPWWPNYNQLSLRKHHQ